MSGFLNPEQVVPVVRRIVDEIPVLDIHTHIYPPAFGGLLLWGIDELLTYHYLVAETFRHDPMSYEAFWALSKREQADRIWRELFIENSPISESCRGVLTCLRLLGLDPKPRDLEALRRWFAAQEVEDYVEQVFRLANVRAVIMTNNPFDDEERPTWLAGRARDPRFRSALRLDPILMEWPKPVETMRSWGYDVGASLTQACLAEVRRFLGDWIERMDAQYMAVSLPPSFRFPEKSDRAALIERAVLPVARERGIPFAMMIGVNKLVNPGLRLAGDGVGRADNGALERLCRDFPENRFLATYLSRENQHELCISARKFANLHPFGCWWFLNNPSIIEEITRERIELLGTSFTPQHSDARVLDQLLYKWRHSRDVIAAVLADKYRDLAATGWGLTEDEVRRDVTNYFGGSFERFLRATPRG